MTNIASGEVKDVYTLLEKMRTYNRGLRENALQTLAAAFGDSLSEGGDGDGDGGGTEFWTASLRAMARYVLESAETFGGGDIPVLHTGSTASVAFTAKQCVTIVSIGFFNAWPFRTEVDPRVALPHMNFSQLLGPSSPDRLGSQIAKLRCLVNYVLVRTETYVDPWGGSGWEHEFWPDVVVTRRHLATGFDRVLELRGSRTVKKTSAAFYPAGSMTEDAVSHPDDPHGRGTDVKYAFVGTEVDFAAAYLGGGILGRGAVQEEIRFAQCPDLLAARLVCARLAPEDAVVVEGFDVTNVTSGYARALRYEATHRHGSPDSIESHTLIAIDAVNYGLDIDDSQFTEARILREVAKAYTGFFDNRYPDNRPAQAISTGNWGAGAFRGDPLLKVAIQVVAATLANRSLDYFTFEAPPSSTAGLATRARAYLDTFDGTSARDMLAAVIANPPRFQTSASAASSTGAPLPAIEAAPRVDHSPYEDIRIVRHYDGV